MGLVQWLFSRRSGGRSVSVSGQLTGQMASSDVVRGVGDAADRGSVSQSAQAMAELLIQRGNALEDVGLPEQAIACYDQAIQTCPGMAKAHLNRGNGCLAAAKIQDALASYQYAIGLQPTYTSAHFNLGNAFTAAGQPAQALAAYGAALKHSPAFLDARIAQANTLGDLGRTQEAVIAYTEALQQAPHHPQIHRNLGLAHRTLGQLALGADCFQQAIQLAPADLDAHCDLANIQRERGDVTEAVATARLACDLAPTSAGARSLLLFCLSHSLDISKDGYFAEHRKFATIFEAPFRALWQRPNNSDHPNRVLQVGLVSADLRSHALASFFEPVYNLLLTMPSLQLHVYDTGGAEDAVSMRMRARGGHWTAAGALDDDGLAQAVRRDAIDVLIDLAGHTPGHRLLAFARRIAPIQMSWMGYPGTTGLTAMDYYIGDRHFLPAGEFDADFSEKIIRLPANAPFQSAADAPDVNGLPALHNGRITFGSFNRLDKINTFTVRLWAQVLARLPNSHMLIAGMPSDDSSGKLKQWFLQQGIGAHRLEFRGRTGMREYLALHGEVDVCLDAFPYGGGTTTCHAAWMGVPTLTLTGHTPPSGSGRSVMSHLGLQDAFVAHTEVEYVAKAEQCCSNLPALAETRRTLRHTMQVSSMVRPEVVAGAFECAARYAWQQWCEQAPPRAFEVTCLEPGMFDVVVAPAA